MQNRPERATMQIERNRKEAPTMELRSNNRYYTPYTYKKVPEKLFYRTEPDFRQEKNLLSGKKYDIVSYGSIDAPYDSPQYNTPDTDPRLTDGVRAEKASMNDPAWARFSRGVARSILFDIGGIAAVKEFRIRCLWEKQTAVKLPNNVSCRRTAWILKTSPCSTDSVPTGTRRWFRRRRCWSPPCVRGSSA